jgi:BTB/POZ domain-containing protein KCTD9
LSIGGRLVGIEYLESCKDKADFTGASLIGALFTRANLKEARFLCARKIEIQSNGRRQQRCDADLSTDLRGADFTEALLQGTTFDDAQLQGARFTRAMMQGSSLANANLAGATLSYARLEGASLADAALRGISFVATAIRGLQASNDPPSMATSRTFGLRLA